MLAENFSKEIIFTEVEKKMIKPGIQFDLEFKIWISDHFMQPAYGNTYK